MILACGRRSVCLRRPGPPLTPRCGGGAPQRRQSCRERDTGCVDSWLMPLERRSEGTVPGPAIDLTSPAETWTALPCVGESAFSDGGLRRGTDNLHARFRSPVAGRFFSVDPVLPIERTVRNPQGWNRYAYVLDNPLKYVDSTGTIYKPAQVPATQDSGCQGFSGCLWYWLKRTFNSDPHGLTGLANPMSVVTAVPRAFVATRVAISAGRAASASEGAVRLFGTGSRAANAGGKIVSFVLEEDTVLYRVFSGDNTVGSFLTAVRPRSAQFAREALDLPPGNTAEFVQEVLVPAGTRLQRSRVLPGGFGGRGGAEQYELLDYIPIDSFGPGVPLP